jgi:hypothetical protein
VELALLVSAVHARFACNLCDHHWSVQLRVAGANECVVPVGLLAQTLDVLRPYTRVRNVRMSNGRSRACKPAWEVSRRIAELMAGPAVAQVRCQARRPRR